MKNLHLFDTLVLVFDETLRFNAHGPQNPLSGELA